MTTIKIYSHNKPLKINGHLEIYNISDGVKNNRMWYHECTSASYNLTRAELEKEGYTAHPASSKEIASKNYTIFFQEAV
jgi:hypothetical protein